MTVFDKFADNLLVMSHYFFGISTFLIFAFNFFNRKGSRLHQFSGRLYLVFFLILVLLGLISGAKEEFYDDRSIKLMLWIQSFFTLVLVYHAWQSGYNKKHNLRDNKLVIFLICLTMLLAGFAVVVGILKGQSITTGMCVVLIILAMKLLLLPKWNHKLYDRVYQHASAMGLTGLFLIWHASGFFGIHDVLDKMGEVSWLRAFASFGVFMVLVGLGEFYIIKRFKFLKK